jgi:hypothetical protein
MKIMQTSDEQTIAISHIYRSQLRMGGARSTYDGRALRRHADAAKCSGFSCDQLPHCAATGKGIRGVRSEDGGA